MKNLLRLCEIDSEYGVKAEVVRVFVPRYDMLVMGVGEPLYRRDELEDALVSHAKDGRPTISEMNAQNKRKRKKTLGIEK